jgi:sugar O-acyltransferase (sialic acid O-acetyltransferase NeuD family)
MKHLIIIGARGFGRELYDLAQHCTGYNEQFIIKGFLDDNSGILNDFEGYPPILNSVEDYVIEENDVFISALGSVKWTKHYIEIIRNKGGEFINLIHKDATLRKNVKLGYGIIIGPGSLISTDVKIDDFSQIMSYCILGHDVSIGKYCRIGDYVFFGGFAKTEDSVFVAVRSTVFANVQIEKEVTVGACSVVIKNIKQGITVFGNPAKELKF